MSSSKHIVTDMRSALRERLLGISTVESVVLPTASVSGKVLTAPGVDFEAEGFWPGAYLTLSSFGAASGTYRMAAVEPGKITFVDVVPSASATAAVASIRLPDVAWDDETYVPKPGTPYINEAFRRVGGRPVLFGGQWRHNMLLTLTLFWPAGQGTIGPESMAGRLLELYRPGVGLAYGANKGKVTAADQPPHLKEPAWTSYPVTVAVTAWTDN